MVKLLSVVVSVYNEELALREFYQETGAVLKALPSSWDYELLFVNDGSADRSLEILWELARRDSRVRVVEFSRNFGHEAAMIAGIDYARGAASSHETRPPASARVPFGDRGKI